MALVTGSIHSSPLASSQSSPSGIDIAMMVTSLCSDGCTYLLSSVTAGFTWPLGHTVAVPGAGVWRSSLLAVC